MSNARDPLCVKGSRALLLLATVKLGTLAYIICFLESISQRGGVFNRGQRENINEKMKKTREFDSLN